MPYYAATFMKYIYIVIKFGYSELKAVVLNRGQWYQFQLHLCAALNPMLH